MQLDHARTGRCRLSHPWNAASSFAISNFTCFSISSATRLALVLVRIRDHVTEHGRPRFAC